MPNHAPLSPRSFNQHTVADSWEEIWEAGPYYARVSEAMEQAEHYAIFVGWQIDSRLPMDRPQGGRETFKEKILRLCESKPGFHFYFLMWDHAYFYVLERENWQGQVWENVHPRVHFIFDNRHPFGGSHHEKISIFDGKTVFCGGIDLCDDRWDSPEHRYHDPRRSLNGLEEAHGPYHDLAVRVTGPICAPIQRHIAERWEFISSVPFPVSPAAPPSTEPKHSVYLSRTHADIDAGDAGVPITREIEFLFRDLIRNAQDRIIIEGQYYWSREIHDLLVAKVHAMKGTAFEIILVLADLMRTKSLTRLMATYEMTLLERLEQAAAQAGVKLVVGSPCVYPPQGDGPSKPIYIHSKLLIVDDRWLCVGSANLSSRALRIDTEICLTLEGKTESDRAHIRQVSQKVLEHWGLLTAEARPTSTPHPDIRLRAIHPRRELAHLEKRSWLSRPWRTALPFQYFFDPVLPWPYRFKHQIRKLAKRRKSAIALVLLAFWLVGAWLALIVSGSWQHHAAFALWPAAYCILLSSAWLFPIPFFPSALLASMHLGVETASCLMTASLWVASLYGYMGARMFPTWVARYYNRIGPRWLPERIGRRSFQALLTVLSDPRIELRTKIVYQGLYCVPLPWFVLGTCLVLPAALYLGCRWAVALASPTLISAVRTHPAAALAGVLFLTGTRAVWRIIAHGKPTTPSQA